MAGQDCSNKSWHRRFRRAAGPLFIVSLLWNSLAFSQTSEIAGQARDCDWLPALHATLNYNGEGTFKGWTDTDRLAASALIKSCKPRWGDRGRSDELVRLLDSRWDEEQHRIGEEIRSQAQAAQLTQDRLAQKQQAADEFSRAHVAQSKTGRAVRIFFISQEAQYHTGDTIPSALLNTILFTREPCPLDIANKEQLLRAWMSYGSHQLGCWGATIDDGFIFFGSIRLEIPECKPPTAFEQYMNDKLASQGIDVRKNELQRARTEIVNTQGVTVPTLYGSSMTCEAARAAEQQKADEVEANFQKINMPPDKYWHSEHYKCVEVNIL